MSDAISPSKGNTRNVKKLEERKTDPLSLEGYVSSASLPKPPEKGKGGCLRGLYRALPQVSGVRPGQSLLGQSPGSRCLARRAPCSWAACAVWHTHPREVPRGDLT